MILAFEVIEIIFWPCKKSGSCTSQGHIGMKKMYKMVVLLWIHFPRQVGYILEISKSFGIVQHIGKNSK